jgi:hypothetical protein
VSEVVIVRTRPLWETSTPPPVHTAIQTAAYEALRVG